MRESSSQVVRYTLCFLALIAAMAVIIFVGWSMQTAQAQSPVSDDKVIIYENQSKYDVAPAVAEWEELDCRYTSPENGNCPGVDFQTAAEAGQDPTLVFSDYSDCNTVTAGRYRSAGTPDHIYLNTCLLDAVSAFDQKSSLVHEIGHALGIPHADVSDPSALNNSVMVPCSECNIWDTPRPLDDKEYYERWVGGA